VLVLALLAVVLLPVTALIALIADLVGGFRRRRWLRLLGMVTTYLVIETIVIFVALLLWIGTGFGVGIHTEWGQRPHRAIQLWWAGRIVRAIEFFFSTSIRIDGDGVVTPGPVIAFARHTSYGDAALPMFILGTRNGLHLRYVLKRETTLIPALDLYGNRLPNHFVDRAASDRGNELDAIRELVTGLDEHSAAVIFPEGTFRTEATFARAIERLDESDPQRAARVRNLRHLLPARPGGSLTILDAAHEADVVIIAHRGFEAFTSVAAIVANVPFDGPVDVNMWRVPRATIPTTPDARMDWLDGQWERLDAWVEESAPPDTASESATADRGST